MTCLKMSIYEIWNAVCSRNSLWKELLTIPEHPNSLPVLGEVRVSNQNAIKLKNVSSLIESRGIRVYLEEHDCKHED
jgi:hypothetical protein